MELPREVVRAYSLTSQLGGFFIVKFVISNRAGHGERSLISFEMTQEKEVNNMKELSLRKNSMSADKGNGSGGSPAKNTLVTIPEHSQFKNPVKVIEQPTLRRQITIYETGAVGVKHFDQPWHK